MGLVYRSRGLMHLIFVNFCSWVGEVIILDSNFLKVMLVKVSLTKSGCR